MDDAAALRRETRALGRELRRAATVYGPRAYAAFREFAATASPRAAVCADHNTPPPADV